MITAYACECAQKAGVYRLLAHAVGELYSIPCPKVEKDGNGKPGFPSRPDIFFSLSHTRTHCLAALGNSPVGCDIELIRQVPQRVILKTCATGELRDFTFFQLWTLKEAYFKLCGSLPHPMWESRFSLTPEGRIIAPGSSLHARLYTVAGCQCALISLSPLPEEIITVPKNLI